MLQLITRETRSQTIVNQSHTHTYTREQRGIHVIPDFEFFRDESCRVSSHCSRIALMDNWT